MAHADPHVKPDRRRNRTKRFLSWIDCHPRLGWYMVVWTAAVNLQVTLNWLDWLWGLLT